MKLLYFSSFLIILSLKSFSQDSTQTRTLKSLNVLEQKGKFAVNSLPILNGTFLYGGRKSEAINLSGIDMSLTDKTARQIFSKTPGVFVYDMDGTGNQINISTRGLDPHRGWEFNIRKDGIMTNTDIYGYPASHYSMPTEAIETIEMVKGTSSLQYGAQFGGMINYVQKQADTTKKASFESINSLGSFNTLSSYNSLSGKIGKLTYYTYYQKRVSNGYRENSNTNSDAFSVQFHYQISKQLKLKFDLSKSEYLIQLAGQQTDSQFNSNPRAATRSRNYYSPKIFVPNTTLTWNISNTQTLRWQSSAVLGNRNSVMFDKPALVKDSINPVTFQFANRQVDIDTYHSLTTELRYLNQYQFLGKSSVWVSGLQFIHNNTNRRQQGIGTTGTDYDLSILGSWGRELNFKSNNIALFLENRIGLSNKLAVTPGIRIENGASVMQGYISYLDPNQVPNRINHKFTLLGLNSDYMINSNSKIYAAFAQSFRPVIFKDMIPGSKFEKSDTNLKDALGYNFELGYHTQTNNFKFEFVYFQLLYKNRLRTLVQKDESGNFQILRTNIGDSFSKGIEAFAEYYIKIKPRFGLSIFSSTSYLNSRYINGRIRSGQENISIVGNKVESTPELISRNGLVLRIRRLSISNLYSYTASSFADALNTKFPDSNGAVGLVPSYGLWDINSTYRYNSKIQFRFNLNNVLNHQYFTKRPQFYPGPGIWASDGRSANFVVGFKI